MTLAGRIGTALGVGDPLEPLRAVVAELRMREPPPERIARAIRSAEDLAEILVSWVQLAGLTLFAAFYVLSHSAFAMRSGIEPVPLALAGYAAFIVWRLRAAYGGRLTARALSLSALADVMMLMIMIWSFTVQYAAPPALYLKAPTLFYVFILIALRALRYDAGHVALTGIAGVAGWMVLVAVAAAGGAPVTRDYFTYMTSLSLLWGAEFEKIAAMLAVTAVLALAVGRTKSLLARTAKEAAAAADLSRFLDPDAARRVRNANLPLKAGDGELKPAAIMFVDLRGFSAAAASLGARDVIALLQTYQARIVPVIEAAGGSVDKYMGDGILVSFGTTAHAGREAAAAFETLPALMAAADAWARERRADNLPPLDIVVAIAVGDVVHGVIGHENRLEFTVIGDAVNLAAKLEKHAKLEGARVIASRDALDRARAQGAEAVALRIVASARVDGVRDAVDLAVIR